MPNSCYRYDVYDNEGGYRGFVDIPYITFNTDLTPPETIVYEGMMARFHMTLMRYIIQEGK